MNRFCLILGILLILIVPQAFDASASCSGPYCDNVFNKMTDSLATVGKDPATAKQIKIHRQRIRRLNRQRSVIRANAAKAKANQANANARRKAWLNSPYSL